MASLMTLSLGCASHNIPAALKGYDILVEPKDEQSAELAKAMKSYGFRVRDQVRGGSKRTAALIYFTFSEPGLGEPTWMHLRLADTRSGAILGFGDIELDSTTATPKARARAAVQALLAP